MLRELTQSLITVLKAQATSMEALAVAMSQQRGSFVSVGRSGVAAGTTEIEGYANNLVTLEQKRVGICRQLQEEFGFTEDLRVSRILERVPKDMVEQLRSASELVSERARRIRIECMVGAQLLKLSEEANAGILESLLGLTQDKGASYDRNARSPAQDLPGGSIVSGTA